MRQARGAHDYNPLMPVRLGLERLLDGPDRKLIDGPANRPRLQSRLDRQPHRPRRPIASSSGDWTLAALFGPQHGFRSDLQENMIESPHAQDAKRRVPVHSLYSETREPTAEMLADVDVLVIDLQDVGTRIYTYIYTMANCLRAARSARHPRRRLRPAQPDRRRRHRGGDARSRATSRSSGSSRSRCATA